jgi:hypothetical protein
MNVDEPIPYTLTSENRPIPFTVVVKELDNHPAVVGYPSCHTHHRSI